MKVAEICITHGRSFSHGGVAGVGFSDTETASAEYERLKAYLDRREQRANDLEKTITVTGINSFTCPGDEITGIGYADFSLMNEEEAGVKDAFPNLFKR